MIADGVRRREDPDIAAALREFYLCLVDMDHRALPDGLPELGNLRAELLKPFFLPLHKMQSVGIDAELFFEQAADQFMAQVVVDIQVDRPGKEIVPEVDALEDNVVVFHPAAGAFAHTRLKFDDPLFDPGGREFQVGLFETFLLLAVIDLLVPAVGALSPEGGDDDLVRLFGLPDHMAAAQVFDLGVGFDG